MSKINRQWVLDRTPTGPITPDVFSWREAPIGQPQSGDVLIRNRMLSADPAQRAWMKGRTYREQVIPGDVMHAFGIGEVVASESPDFAPGDLVEGMLSWQDFALVPAKELTKRAAGRDPGHLIGVLSITGLTAYYGLLDVARIRPGETVLISAAAGAVGSIAGQIAKIAGCRVIGVAGGPEKCAWIVDELGFDAAIDYKAGNVRKQIRALCPTGINVYFDNVGGEVLDAALLTMNQGGRVVCCGSVSDYDDTVEPKGSPLLPGILISRRITMSGFIVLDFMADRVVAEERILRWIADGRLKAVVDMAEGLEEAPATLIRLLAGGNRGKAAIRIA